MPLFKVYIVREYTLGFIDSAWRARLDAERKAETLNIHKTPVGKNELILQWMAEELEVQ